MKCVIIANGDLEYTKDIHRVLKDAQLIISADGGARHLRALNILPHIMIGDFDSISPADKLFFKEKQVRILTFSSRKNHTDSELCVSWALENNATDITLLGVTGTRLDHTLANIFLLKKLARLHIPARIINKNNEIHIVTDFIEIKGQPGNFLSIIPVTEKVTGITLKGLEYPLVNATIEMGSSLGVSNSFKEAVASVSIEKGILIVTKSID
ncbi:MAG: thiamine diphosphokinase [Desulfobacula sp.]|uniref:thiamine diphosphokinase n=1 Tax=Desulfobacula sp. TaxID=2593537 RepID=UPI0025C589EB|nr:thiamine diphosphokinase [Desulfobacula sp.]MCD4722463.1 thiamine diphosphokinase [Desulfobacula sp.]